MTELRTLSKEIVEAAKEMVIAGHTEIAITPRDRFLQAAEKEMAKFERQEREFRKKERADRAAELHLPVHETRQQLQKVAELSGLFR
jgi:exonuclease III